MTDETGLKILALLGVVIFVELALVVIGNFG
jgi:hypothetical protein